MGPLKEHGFLSFSEATTIFAHLPTIINLNSQFLSDLEERIKKWSYNDTIGDILLNYAPLFKVYSAYATSYDRGVHLLKAIANKKKEVKTFLNVHKQTTKQKTKTKKKR